MTLHRQELYKTGGGPSTAPDFDDVEEKVLAICSNISGLDSRNDSDNLTGEVKTVMPDTSDTDKQKLPIHIYQESQDCFETDEMIVEDMQDITFGVDEENDFNKSIVLTTNGGNTIRKDSNDKWGTWNPRSLKSKVTKALKPTKNSVTAKLDELSTERLALVKLEHEIKLKEHAFKKEEHEAKMLYLKNDENRKQELHQLMLDTMRKTQQKKD